eukprot:m.21854 g.21854  ORF g.21854 m.21854 type:complete len:54 (-) comp12549_c0_seq1:225-386(-)
MINDPPGASSADALRKFTDQLSGSLHNSARQTDNNQQIRHRLQHQYHQQWKQG